MLPKLFVLFSLIGFISGSHYRGGTIHWSIRQEDYIPATNSVAVRLTQRHSWRRSAAPSFWNTPMCDAGTISNGTALIGEDYLICRSTDCAYIADHSNRTISTQLLCTDSSVDFDYASGEKETMLVLPVDRRFEYSFASCCWIPLLQVGAANWAVNLVINTHRRLNGRFNNAPFTNMQPIIKATIGRTRIIDIPMSDIEGDRMRCRWGNSSAETGGIYQPKGSLQASPCVLTYEATQYGFEGVGLVIEDFDTNGEVLSSIPLQFLIEIIPEVTTPVPVTQQTFAENATWTMAPTPAPRCTEAPEYKGDWRPGACIGLYSNESTQIRIVVEIPCNESSTGIHDILTISPTGMNKSAITQDASNPNQYIMYMTWTPRRSQYGGHQLCVTPLDNNTQSGRTVCLTLLVDVRSPEFVEGSMSPRGVVLRNQSLWAIATDVDIVPPRDLNVSAVFYKQDPTAPGGAIRVTQVTAENAEYQRRQITFNTGDVLWEEGANYYILLEGGIATINQSCGIQSAPMNDPEFWRFSVLPEFTTLEPTTTTATTTTTSETTTTTESTTTTTTSETTTTTESTTTTTTSETTTTTESTTTTTTSETTTTTESTTTTTTSETTTTTESTTTTTTTGTTTTTETTTTTSETRASTTTTSETTSTTSVSTTTSTTSTTSSSSPVTREIMTTTTTTTERPGPVEQCPEWLPFGTIKNVTTSDSQRNYTFCFYVNTTYADVTVAANTWTSCDNWKTSGASDPLMDLYDIRSNATLLAQNDDGNSIIDFNCYAAVLSYRLTQGNYRVVIRQAKCNYGKFELRLSVETTNALKH